jgi:hypothetical protein
MDNTEKIRKFNNDLDKISKKINSFSDSFLESEVDILNKRKSYFEKEFDNEKTTDKRREQILKENDKIFKRLEEANHKFIKIIAKQAEHEDKQNTLTKKREKLVKEQILSIEKYTASLFNVNKAFSEKQLKHIKEFASSVGFAVEGFDLNNKDARDALSIMTGIEKEKIEWEKKRISQIKDNWYLEYGLGNRLKGLSKSLGYGIKDWFFNQTGILGKSINFVGKLFGKNLGGTDRVSNEEKVFRMEKLNEYINSSYKIHEDYKNLAEKLGQSGFASPETKSRMRSENGDVVLSNSKKMTKYLKLISEKTFSGAAKAGLFSLAGLTALGGLLGYLLTGKGDYLDVIKKAVFKSGLVIFHGINLLLSMGGKLTSAFTGLIRKGLMEIATNPKLTGKIGNVFGKLAEKVLSFGGAIGKMGKLGKMGMWAFKKIPLLGLFISVPLAISKFKKGDILGALLELASGGLASFGGPIGLALSTMIDLFSLGRDLKNDLLPGNTSTSNNTLPSISNNPLRNMLKLSNKKQKIISDLNNTSSIQFSPADGTGSNIAKPVPFKNNSVVQPYIRGKNVDSFGMTAEEFNRMCTPALASAIAEQTGKKTADEIYKKNQTKGNIDIPNMGLN